MNLLMRMQNIDRRILYLLMVLVIVGPLLLKPSRHPTVVFDEVRSAYNTIDHVPKDKMVIISIVYSASTVAENGPQTEALMRHMFSKKIKFAVLAWDAVGAQLSYKAGHELEKEYGRKYGTDWVHLGYRLWPTLYTTVAGMAENFPKVIGHDMFNTKLTDIPITRGVKNYKQIGAVADITSSSSLQIWMAYFNMPYHVPLMIGTTAVYAAEVYPYIDSGQVVGMLNGVMGGAQYETLIGRGNTKTYAAAASWALSSAHIFIILLIILGNLGYLAARRAGQGTARGGASRG